MWLDWLVIVVHIYCHMQHAKIGALQRNKNGAKSVLGQLAADAGNVPVRDAWYAWHVARQNIFTHTYSRDTHIYMSI